MDKNKSKDLSDDQDDGAKDESKRCDFEDVDVSSLLQRIGEDSLIPLFSEQRVTMEMLMDLGHADLREVGVTIFGQRHKILAEVARMKQGKCNNI
jgi:tankyrase